MRSFTSMAGMLVCTLAGAGVTLLAQAAMKPGHERVPPYREPSPYMSTAEIQTGLSKLDPTLVASRTGGAIDFAKGKAVGVVRRRMTGPQYAITHPRTVEYMMVIKGTATLVTGGTLIPPTIDSDPYPNANPNATIRSDVGVKDGLARRIGPGDVVVNLPGTPHWLSQIDGAIDYFEIQIPNMDPAPGIERAEVLPAPATATSSQSGIPPALGTFVTAEEIETVVKAPTGGADREVKIVDVGRYNLGVAVLRRSALKPGGTLNGINHTKLTEVYYVVSGEGTMVMGTDVKDVRPVAADNEIVTTAVGPSNTATFVTPAQTRTIKTGDVVIVPIGVYHGFSEIPDHIEYVSVRPDLDRVLPAGYISPAIRK